jgi:hypothetical protein
MENVGPECKVEMLRFSNNYYENIILNDENIKG